MNFESIMSRPRANGPYNQRNIPGLTRNILVGRCVSNCTPVCISGVQWSAIENHHKFHQSMSIGIGIYGLANNKSKFQNAPSTSKD